MVVFPNAKINIGLAVTEKRADGYHNIETVFYPVKVYDALEVIESPVSGFSSSGIAVPGDDNNLCLKAWSLLRDRYQLPPVKIHLHKNIPVGAGLGGGSADAAFTLKLLNRFFKLGLSEDELETLARQLGSDCAFFIRNEPAFAFGKGDEFGAVALDLSDYYLALVMPPVQVPTAEAYQGTNPEKPANSLQILINTPVDQWKHTISNDFEKSIFSRFPLIASVKEELYRQGALYASMSGSGAAVYGIFKEVTELPGLESACRVFYGV